MKAKEVVFCMAVILASSMAHADALVVFDEEDEVKDLGGMQLDAVSWELAVVEQDAEVQPAKGRRMLRYRGAISGPENSAVHRIIRRLDYPITESTVLSYDVYAATHSVDDGFAVDLLFADGTFLRNVEPQVVDQNRVPAHAYWSKRVHDWGKWYYREFSLGALAGRTCTAVVAGYDDVQEAHAGNFCGYFDAIQLNERPLIGRASFQPPGKAQVLEVIPSGLAPNESWVVDVASGEKKRLLWARGAGNEVWRAVLDSAVADQNAHVRVSRVGFDPSEAKAQIRLADLPPSRLKVDLNAPRQTIRGFGGQADFQIIGREGREDGVTREDYESLIQACVDNGFRWARIGLWNFEEVNDDDDPNHYNWEAFGEGFASMYAGLPEHIKHLKSVGIEPLVVPWGFPGSLCGPDLVVQMEEVPEVAENCAALLKLLHEAGAAVRYFTIENEPEDHSYKIHDPAVYAAATRQLASRLKDLGLEAELVAMDLSGDLTDRAPRWLQNFLPLADDLTNIVAFHPYCFAWYLTPRDIPPFYDDVRAGIDRWSAGGKPKELWVTEYNSLAFGNADNDRRAHGGPCDSWKHGMAVAEMTHYLLDSGVATLFLWEMYDLRRQAEPPKRWGTIKYKTENWAKRPSYYTLGMYSRFIKPGYRMISVADTERGALGAPLAVAAVGDSELVVILDNPYTFADSTEIQLPPSADAGGVCWQTTETGQFVRQDLRTTGARAAVALPAQSITALIVPLTRETEAQHPQTS